MNHPRKNSRVASREPRWLGWRGALLSAALAAAAWGQVDAPLLGYVPDQGRIRPVYGIAAAASVGAALAGGPFAQLAAAPGGTYVLTSAAGSGQVAIYADGEASPLEGAGTAPDAIALSPRGTAAVLWFASISRAQVAGGLPGDAALRHVDAPFRPSIPAALAVSDDGQWFAGVWSTGLYAFGPHGEMVALTAPGHVRALAFSPGGHDLAVAAPTGVVRLSNVDGSGSVTPVFDPGEETFRPVGVAIDGTHAIAADQGGAVIRVDLATGASSTVACQCTPEGLFGMGAGVYRLTGLRDGSLRLFESATGRVLFAPLALEQGGRP